MNKIDMSSDGIDLRLRRLSELRELCLSLKWAGKKEGLNSKQKEPIKFSLEVQQKLDN